MFEAYKIGVRIGVVDATGGGILKIVSQLDRAQRSASKFLDSLGAIQAAVKSVSTSATMDGVADSYRRAAQAADAYARAAARAATASARAAAGGASGAAGNSYSASQGRYSGAPPTGMAVYRGGGMGLSMVGVGLLAAASRKPAMSVRQLPGVGDTGASFDQLPAPVLRRALGFDPGSVPMVAAGGRGGGIGAVRGGGVGAPLPDANFSAGAYVAGRRWSGGGGGGGGRGYGGGGGGGNGFGQLGGMLGGMFIEQSGHASLELLKRPLDAASEFQTEVSKFSLYGLGDKLNAQAVQFAKGMNVIGTSMTDAMRYMTEAQGVFRESGLSGDEALSGAKLASPVLAKIAFATSSLDGESRERMRTQSLSMLRFIEMRGGLKDATTFNSIADAGWKAMRSSGGNVNWEQLRQFMARGGVAAQGLSNKALFGELEPVIGELKGSTAGNAWMTSYNRLVGGVRVPNQVAHLLADNGVWDASKIQWNSQGGIKQFNGNPLKDMQTFASDPVAFYEKTILPMYQRLGIQSSTDKGRENTLIFGRTGGAMFSLIDRQLATIHRSVDAQNKTLGIDASVKQQGGTLAGQELDWQAKFNDLMNALGTTILPLATRGLKFLNPLLEGAAHWVDKHTTLVKGLLVGFAALGVAMMIGGPIVALAGAFSLVGAAVGTAGGIAGMLTTVATGFGAVATTLGLVAGALAGGIWAGAKISDKLDGTWVGDHIAHYGTKAAASVMGWWGNKDNDYTNALKYDGFDQKYNGAAPLPGQAGYKAPASGSPFVMSRAQQTVQVNSTINIDGRKVANAVTQHQVKATTGPQTGTSGFDSSQFAAPIGINLGF